MARRRLRGFLTELQHRRVPRTVLAYLLIAAGAVEVVDIVVPRLGLPDWTVTVVVWLATLGLPLTIWAAWDLDVTAEGIRRTDRRASRGGGEAAVAAHAVMLITGAAAATALFAVLLLVRPWDAGPTLVDRLAEGRLRPIDTSQALDLHPSWSPDGSSLAFGRVEKGDMDVYVMGIGGEPIQVTTHPADDISPRYSPDGARIAFLSDRGGGLDVYWVSPTGGRERHVARTNIPLLDFGTVWFRGLGAQPWSTDGSQLVFPRLEESGAVALWMIDLGTGEESRVTRPPAGALDLGAAWSADGKRLLFDRTEGGVSSLWIMERMDTGLAEPVRLSDPGDNDFGAAWLPDASGVVFASARSGAIAPWAAPVDDLDRAVPLPSPALWVYHIDVRTDGAIAMATANHTADLFVGPRGAPSEHRNVSRNTSNQFGAAYRGAGEVLYHGDRSGNYDIWMYRIEDDTHVPLTEDPAFDVMPHASPAGDIAFVSGRAGALRPWVLDAGGSEPRLLLDREISMSCDRHAVYCRGPRWSPDGRLIGVLVAGAGTAELWVVRPDGSGALAIDAPGIIAFDWFLDGDRIIYVRKATSEGAGELRARNIRTGQDALILSGLFGEPSVSASGRRLAVLTSQSHYHMDAYEIALTVPGGRGGLPRAAGDPVPLTSGRGAWHTHNLAWSPDGEFIAYTRDTDAGDLYVIEPTPATGR